MTALKELLDRVNAATGPMTTREVEECIRLSPWYADRPSHDPIWNDFCKALYGSVDAALALVERVLPGWTIASMQQQDDKTWFCELREGYLTSYGRVATSIPRYGERRPPTLPLAILSALLTALIARAGQ